METGNTKKKVLLLLNSSSGMGKGKQDLFQIVQELSTRQCEVTVYPCGPESGMDSDQIIEERYKDFDVVACYGGDGTMNHMVNTMMKRKIHPIIGYIPGGSTNDFARNFADVSDLSSLCDAVACGEPFTYDVGLLNHTYFNYVAAFGAFTDVSYSTDQVTKNMLGHNAYIVSAMSSLGDALNYRRHLVFEHDGMKEEGDYIYGGISNSPSIGGMKFSYNERAKLNDGLFEVMLVTAPNNPADLAGIASQIASGDMSNKYVRVFQTNAISFRCDEKVDWTVDGEFGGSFRKSDITLIPSAMKIMAGKKILASK
jgi:YegS/Rv2252/BmrU family lipid kinase